MSEVHKPARASSALGTYRRLLGYTRSFRGVAVLAVLGMVLDAACMTVFARLIKPLLDNLFVQRDPATIFWMPLIIIGIFVVRGMATYVTDYGTAFVGRGVVQKLRRDVFEKYLRMPAAFFDAESSGNQIARITYTAEQVAHASTDAVKIVMVDGLTVIGYITVMLLASVYLTLALLVMVPLVGALVSVGEAGAAVRLGTGDPAEARVELLLPPRTGGGDVAGLGLLVLLLEHGDLVGALAPHELLVRLLARGVRLEECAGVLLELFQGDVSHGANRSEGCSRRSIRATTALRR